jgi:hypothetical protein
MAMGRDFASDRLMFAAFHIPLSWSELLKRTAKEASEDDVLGLAAQLAYYFFWRCSQQSCSSWRSRAFFLSRT